MNKNSLDQNEKNKKYIVFAEYIINLCKNIVGSKIESVFVSIVVPVIKDTIKSCFDEFIKSQAQQYPMLKQKPSINNYSNVDVPNNEVVHKNSNIMELRNAIKQKMLGDYLSEDGNQNNNQFDQGNLLQEMNSESVVPMQLGVDVPNGDVSNKNNIVYHNVYQRDYRELMKAVEQMNKGKV